MPPPASYHKPDTYLHMCLQKGRAHVRAPEFSGHFLTLN
ncbi:hypothetical protein FHS77_002235 [Paenochrobactrum gallinarii]|uniref:Uncharacterized protein n=1 Tax=Paenochrobactrum gallinarii TaxID=643673 RepID=A0A841LWH2_9HYPH|nr:hypothetical protein [Paenochrobactrum gallinarii]